MEIRSKSKITEWNYIPTNLNTSDLCTRPTSFKEFQTSKRYLSGPIFLQSNDITSFIGKDRIFNEKENFTKNKVIEVCNTLSQEIREPKALVVWKKISLWKKLLRAIFFLKKFIRAFKLRKTNQCRSKTLQTTTDIINNNNQAHDLIIERNQNRKK